MPRKAILSEETIISSAFEIVRDSGLDALTARALSNSLGCSLSPIFTVFGSMEDIKERVRNRALEVFDDYVKDINDYTPAFKEFGLRIVRFAKENQNLFRLLFLDADSRMRVSPVRLNQCLDDMGSGYGLEKDQLELLFRQIWPFVCGLAVINSMDSSAYSEETISEMITTHFLSQMFFLKSGKKIVNVTPHLRKDGELTTMQIKDMF